MARKLLELRTVDDVSGVRKVNLAVRVVRFIRVSACSEEEGEYVVEAVDGNPSQAGPAAILDAASLLWLPLP